MKKIAYVRVGKSSYSNIRVLEMLKKTFPDYKIEDINLIDIIKKKPILNINNIIYIIRQYGYQIIKRKRSLKTAYFITTYIINKMRQIASNEINKSQYTIIFQTNATFDASVATIPYFIYTDGTLLSNIYHKNFEKSILDNNIFKFRIEKQAEAYRNAKYIFTWSPYINKSLIEQYNIEPEKVCCVYYGVNAKLNDIQLENEEYKNNHILFIGGDWIRKGGPELISAFEIVLKKNRNAKLMIVGCSPKINVPNCKIIGKIPPSEINYFLKKASIFCLPTKLEGSSIAIIEAMMSKLPVITTNIPSNKNIILNDINGYLIEPEDIHNLAERINYLLNNPRKCKELGENGYKMVVGKYSWEKVGEKIRKKIDSFII